MPPLLVVKRQMQAESGRTSLSSEEGERAPRRPRPRLETLSDLIYGLSLSIGAISLVITNSQSSSASDINRNILEFLFVFLILITSWIIYTSDMSVLPIETRLVTFLNVVLLILVAIIPTSSTKLCLRSTLSVSRSMRRSYSQPTSQARY